VVLGIVPSGSGDGLARGLGLALDPAQAFGPLLVRRSPSMWDSWAIGTF
jgi:diacylglycerol kinase family enzyme